MTHLMRGGSDLLEPPLHGNRGDMESATALEAPLGLTIAVSREAGARGGSIARRVGRKFGCEVYTQEHLEYLCGNDTARALVLTEIPPTAAAWADAQLDRLRQEKILNPDVELDEMPRLLLMLAARGNVILVGRGAGYLLPRESTLHVRIVAPPDERVAYMMQHLRLTQEEAAQQVHERDEKRAEFLMTYFRRRAGELYDYDMVLNSYLLGEELSAELIAVAARSRSKPQ